MHKILVFYDRHNVDAFVAAHAAWIHLPPKSSGFIAVGKGDTLPCLDGKYLLFFGVDFLSLAAVPDASKAINGVYVGRFDQFEVFKSLKLFPKTTRYYSNDIAPLTLLTWRHFIPSPTRRAVVVPAFVQRLLQSMEMADESSEDSDLLLGLQYASEVANNDPAAFSAKYVEGYKKDPIDIVNTLAVEGSKRSGSNTLFVTKIIERNTLTTNFLGHDVKLCQAPEELADAVGRQLSQRMPFAVVYEDHLADKKRVYRLYSDKNGLDVVDVGKSVSAVGTPRFATFSVKINFDKHNWV